MSDLSLAIKLTTEGGQIVVKELAQIGQSAGDTSDKLNSTNAAGQSAAKGFDSATKSGASLNNQMSSLRGMLGMVAGAFGVFSASSFFKGVIDEAEQLQRNMLRTQAVINATGQAAGFSAEELHKQARELALATLQSTEGVMHAQQVLLSYSSIASDVFSRAIETATDLSTLIGGSLNGSLEMLAKTLDNPIEGINAMRRQGIYFTDAQQNVIKSLIETNRLADAQRLILDELAGQFGGIAKQEALGLSGAYDTLNQAIQESKLAISDQLDTNEKLAVIVNDLATAVFSFNDALKAGELDDYLDTLALATKVTLALLAAKYGAAAASAVWAGAMSVATAASAAFSAQNALTTKSLFSFANAANVAVSAFIGWEIGSYLRNEFAVVEKAGIALAAGIHKVLVWIKGHFESLAESVKYALTHPLDFAKEKFIDYLQWLTGLGSKTLGMLGLDGVFDELNGKLDGYRSTSAVEHKSALEDIKSQTAAELKQIDAIYGEMFTNVAEGSARAAKSVKSIPTKVPAPTLDEPAEEVGDFNKALLALYNTQKLNAEAVDTYGRALTGIDLELFKTQFKEVTDLPENASEAIRLFVKTAEDAAKVTAADEVLKSLQEETALLAERLKVGEKEYEIQKALAALKGTDPAVLEAIEAELRLRQELQSQISISEEISSGAFNKTLDEMTALTSAGESFGDALTQAFGRVAQQIDGMAAAQVNYNQKLDELKKKRKEVEALEEGDPKRAKALIDIKNKEAALTKENFQAQLGQFAALSGAASQMFGEQSKEREALHKLEMAFGVAEIAMSLQKAGANALTAITSAFSAPFPLNFAAGAAMIAIMAGLGVFSGGSSASVPSAADRQAGQGTGTVFGDTDAKSESIANALERIESLELDQYGELREINANIKSLSAGIANLAVSLVGNYGKFNEDNYSGELGTVKRFGNQSAIDFMHLQDQIFGGVIGAVDKLLGGALSDIAGSIIGGISKTTKKLLDSGISFDAQELGEILATGLVEGSYYNVIETTKRKLWGLSKKTKQNTEYTDLDNALEAEFGRIFASIGNSITAAVDMLGLDTTKLLANFVIDLPALSFKDLSGDEIQAELEAIFSAQADLMVQYLVPAIGEYQQMGEGLYETLIRVAQEQAVFNAQMDALGLQLSRFGDIAADTQIAIAQSIIELMGGIEEFRDATAQYFSSFYSEAEQFEYLSSSLAQAMSDLGVSLPATRDGFKALIDGIDLTTEAGQALYAALMALVPGLDEYFKAMERQTEAAEKAAEAERKLAEQRAAYNAGNANELARFDMSPLQLAIDDLNEWYQNAIKEAEELGADTGLLTSIYARRKENLAEKTLQQAIDTANNAMTRLVTDYERASGALQSTLQQQTNAINGMVNSIAGTISSIQQTLPGFDNVAFLRGRVSELAGGVGSGSIDEQLSKAGELQQAIQARYNAELAANRDLQNAAQGRYDALASELSTLQSDFESAGAALRDAFDQVVERIAGAAKSVAQTAAQIRLSMPGADAAGYYSSLVSSLRGQLGGGDIDSQLTLVSELQNAIQARYNAELQQLEQVQQVADEQYQLQLDQYNTALSTYRELAKAAEALRDAAAALQIGDLSPLTTGERLRETQSQLQQAMQNALSGDAGAYGDVQQLGQRYLELARDFNPASYQGAFDYITGLFDQLGGTTFAEPTAPRPHADTTRYEQEQISLAQAALAELAQLQQFTQALESTAANTLHNDLTALESTYNANTTLVNAQMQQLQDELAALEQQQIVLAQAAISELAALQSTVAGLQTLANTEYAAGVEELKAQFAQDSAAITASFETSLAELTDLMPAETDRVVAKLQEQIDALYQMGTDITGAIRETPAQTPDVVVNVPEIVVPPVVFPPELIDPIIKRPPDGIYPDPNPILSDIRNELQQHRQQRDEIAASHRMLYEQQLEQQRQLTLVTERFGREIVDLSNEQLANRRAIA
ncbi:phage tail length tape measure family protein [Rheinheimera maricola]|uniref:Phage tail length tape measure family protein n=1 Tax=Rheinheimera maricola TaxID=2793282 RepID=A0ABS7X9B3_9GAMM|nr:phage tail length tape measure family protein [Rheinheimera maricola]MBZ9612138.1 phage tail length tape measure family protein [Rheinheimera maricola]